MNYKGIILFLSNHFSMKYFRFFTFLGFVFFFLGCSKDNQNNNNPFLPNYPVNELVDTNLPSYSALKFTGNYATITHQGAGIRGIVVFNSGSGILAYDMACPNQALTDCSTLTINGINAICPCDNVSYSLFTGQGGLQYPLKSYRTEINGDVIRVYN